MDLSDLYQEIIIDHNRAPRNFRRIDAATHHADGFNPLCGDRLSVYLDVDDHGTVRDAAFEGSGCAISVASASLMTERIKGKTSAEVRAIFDDFHRLVTGSDHAPGRELGKLAAFAGVRAYPSRVKCATLCWHAMKSALEGKESATTE
jgi:nitrogen fixation NifU-like protein